MNDIMGRRPDGSIEFCRGNLVEVEIDGSQDYVPEDDPEFERFFLMPNLKMVNAQQVGGVEWDVYAIRFRGYNGPVSIDYFRSITGKMTNFLQLAIWCKLKDAGLKPGATRVLVPGNYWLTMTLLEEDRTLCLDCIYKLEGVNGGA